MISEKYETDELGEEVTGELAEACATFWTKDLPEKDFKNLLESMRTPRNCEFLNVQQVNKEIWGNAPNDIRTRDFQLQKIQDTFKAMTTAILRGANVLGSIKSDLGKINPDLEEKLNPVMDSLRDALMLAGKTRIQVNSHRRLSFRPSISNDLKAMTDQPPDEENSKWLFGDNLSERISSIQGDNKAKLALKKKEWKSSETSTKRQRETTTSKSGNDKTLQKSREGYKGSSQSRDKG